MLSGLPVVNADDIDRLPVHQLSLPHVRPSDPSCHTVAFGKQHGCGVGWNGIDLRFARLVIHQPALTTGA